MASLPRFREMILDAAGFLEENYTCKKHRVIHTGSNAYALDFYSYLGEIEKGKKLIGDLLSLITKTEEGTYVFYPGHLNPMNMSQNVIDTGTAVDTIARFMRLHHDSFSNTEHQQIKKKLKTVIDSYLSVAARDKQITNQRLWGLTGLASYAAYSGEEKLFTSIAQESIARAFGDTTSDGFFRYFPNPAHHSLPYDDVTTFYQSRHTAFIEYTLNLLSMNRNDYAEKIETSISALMAMYDVRGIKDLRLECKRWYWLSSYEVASHAFDAFALSRSSQPLARTLLNNVLFQIRTHFSDGFLHSHKGINLNFQCPIFWTAHLAWLVRIEDIEPLFDRAETLIPFSFEFSGKEVYTNTTQNGRLLINTRFSKRNPTTGIFDNGLEVKKMFLGPIPKLPHAYFFSLRETVNHSWYALRGFHIIETLARLFLFAKNSLVMLMPLYAVRYGQIISFGKKNGTISVTVIPGSKYGTVVPKQKKTIEIL